MHYLFQIFEIAIVHIGFHQSLAWTHVDIAQSRYLDFRVELRREFNPLRIRIQLAAIALQRAQEEPDSVSTYAAPARLGL